MNRARKKLALLICVVITSCLILSCGNGGTEDNVQGETAPEVSTVRLALSEHGHVFNIIAEEQGYLADEGITVEYVPVTNDEEVFAGIKNGTIDIASNSGTNLPLQKISEGLDLTIFGGYMLTGCMPVFTKVDTKWEDIGDLVGKTFACEPNLYAIIGPLLDRGYDPLNDIKWYETENQEDRIKAVLNGDADFGLVGTQLNYEINTNPKLKVCTYASDVLPNYSCCRVEASTEWVNNNPNTVKALLRAWIRAADYYDAHHDETVALVAEKIGKEEEYLRAFMDNPHLNLNLDPMTTSVEKAWDYMDRLGLLDADAKQINIDDHINAELFKEALDECQEKYGADNPKFYEKMQGQFARYNPQE